jgi:hypothetical protein
MKNPALQFAKFISTVDQLTAHAKAVINQRIDDPQDNLESLVHLVGHFCELSRIDVEDSEEELLRSMARFAVVGIGSVLKSICEEELEGRNGE